VTASLFPHIASDREVPRGVRIERIDGYGAAREEAERALRAQQVPRPLPQNAAWQHAYRIPKSVALVARDADNRACGAIAASIGPSRALPGHSIYRIERMQGIPDGEMRDRLIAALVTAARKDRRCLRVVIEIFERDSQARAALSSALASAGFKRVEQGRMYTHTLAIDLSRDEHALFASLHSTARYNVRSAVKRGLVVRPITEVSLAPQLGALSLETYKRRRAQDDGLPWERIIALSQSHPGSSQIIGVFDETAPANSQVVAYAWGCAHGDYASYEAGASARRPELKNTPLGYAPLWELIRWARNSAGIEWFDLGGIQPAGTEDSLSGISRFKRYFSDDVVEVGAEWIFEPHPARAAVARAIKHAATWTIAHTGSGRIDRVVTE